MLRLQSRVTAACCLTVLAGLAGTNPAEAQSSIQFIGDVPGGQGTHANAISADGQTVAGFGYFVLGGVLQSHAIRWTKAAGVQPVFAGQLDYTSNALGISADGQAVCGWHAPTIVEEKAFIWSVTGGEALLATRSAVKALSADGRVGAGYVVQGRGGSQRATRWVDGQPSFIDSPDVSPGSDARAVSPDGTIIVGQASFTNVGVRAFLWTPATGMQNIGSPAGGWPTHADAMTPDGRVVVGAMQPGGLETPARWTASSGWTLLGNLPGVVGGSARGVSADGRVVIGNSGGRAFIWREGQGMLDLALVTGAPPGSALIEATAITPDGRTVVGNGTLAGVGAGAWIATIDLTPPCNLADLTGVGGTLSGAFSDGQLTVDDVIEFFNSFSNSDQCPGYMPCNRADVTGIGGPPATADGQLTVDDIIAFFNAFSDGC